MNVSAYVNAYDRMESHWGFCFSNDDDGDFFGRDRVHDPCRALSDGLSRGLYCDHGLYRDHGLDYDPGLYPYLGYVVYPCRDAYLDLDRDSRFLFV